MAGGTNCTKFAVYDVGTGETGSPVALSLWYSV